MSDQAGSLSDQANVVSERQVLCQTRQVRCQTSQVQCQTRQVRCQIGKCSIRLFHFPVPFPLSFVLTVSRGVLNKGTNPSALVPKAPLVVS